MMRATIIAVGMAWAFVSAPAYASRPPVASMFDKAAVSLWELRETVGTGNAFDRNYADIISQNARTDEAVFYSVSRTAMDAWWANVGSELIAANLR